VKKTFYTLGSFLFLSAGLQAQTPQIKWWYDVLDSSFGQSAAGDIDKDGKLEIVFGCYRNDSCIYALNGENGSLQWKFNAKTANAEGCNDVAVLLYDIDQDDTLDVIVPSSCNPKTYCFRGKNGDIKWQTPTGGSDSPPTLADLDNDGKPEILHGGFDGKVLCINGENGSVAWSKQVFSNAWVQTAPTIVDLDGNGQLDFVVATWAFSPDTSRVYAYRGNDQSLLWSRAVSDVTYHGFATGDLDQDGKPELVLGDYNGVIYALNGENGSMLWTYQASVYVGAPVTLADVNHDGNRDVIYCDGYGVGALSKSGASMWYYPIPNAGQSFRGVAIGDINGDQQLDIVFGTNTGKVYVLKGADGSLIWDMDLEAHMGKNFEIDHAPLLADFDQDGTIDIFVVGGDTQYPNFQANYGRAYLISAGTGHGPDWLMFQHDIRRQSSLCNYPLANEETSMSQAPFTMYPNPAYSSLAIRAKQTGTIEIYSMTGQRIMSHQMKTTDETVDISLLSEGIYSVLFSTPDSRVSRKLIKLGIMDIFHDFF